MSSDNTYDFVKQALMGLSAEFDIPISAIPQLIALMEMYSDMSVRGSQKGLYDGLERIVETLKNEGMLK